MNTRSVFFYRSNNRGEPGVNWAWNTDLPQSTRNCSTSIGVLRWMVEKCQETNDNLVTSVFYRNKFEGKYTMGPRQMREWLEINGYYRSAYGETLQIPLVLWGHLIDDRQAQNKELERSANN